MSVQFELGFTGASEPQQLFELAEAALQKGARSLLILAADANDCRPEAFDAWLKRCPVPVFGGVFPQLIHGGRNHERGYIVAALDQTVTVHPVAGLSDADADYFDAIEPLFADRPEPVSMMVLVDGLASRIGALLDSVYDVLGSDPSFFGGGAGSLSFVQKPCLFSNQGMLVDHAQLIELPARFSLGVDHGWEKFAGPFVVTSGDRNVLESLDFKPAFEVYKQHVEADSGLVFTADNFFDIAKSYPFGMEKPDGSIVVRDPITRDGNNMVCVGEVPKNSIVHLLKGHPENLISAAGRGASALPAGKGAALLTDCISRVLYLENRFVEELQAVQQQLGERALFGMLSLGEVANGGDYCLEFYNKTLVIAAAE